MERFGKDASGMENIEADADPTARRYQNVGNFTKPGENIIGKWRIFPWDEATLAVPGGSICDNMT